MEQPSRFPPERRGLTAIPNLVPAQSGSVKVLPELAWIDDTDDQQIRGMLLRQRERPVGGDLGCLRQIGRQQDAPDLDALARPATGFDGAA